MKSTALFFWKQPTIFSLVQSPPGYVCYIAHALVILLIERAGLAFIESIMSFSFFTQFLLPSLFFHLINYIMSVLIALFIHSVTQSPWFIYWFPIRCIFRLSLLEDYTIMILSDLITMIFFVIIGKRIREEFKFKLNVDEVFPQVPGSSISEIVTVGESTFVRQGARNKET